MSIDEIAALEDLSAQPIVTTAKSKDESRSGRKGEEVAAAQAEAKEGRLAAANYSLQVNELQQGLVGGVKPLPITIPETGKSLVLTGVLPPERVSVTIDVKGAKK